MITLVLLPGLDGSGLLVDPFVDSLGPSVETRVVSYPGSEVMDYDQLKDLVQSSLPAEGPFAILAESFSGPIAIAIAADWPDRLKGVILCCSFVRNPRPILLLLYRLLGKWVPIKLAMALATPFLVGRHARDGLQTDLKRAMAATLPSVLQARLAAVASVDVRARLAKCRGPVLVLQASRDRVVPHRETQFLKQVCPQVELMELDGPHLLLEAAPSRTAQVVTSFLRRIVR